MIKYSVYNESNLSIIKDDWKYLERESNNTNLSVSFDWCMTWWNLFKDREDNTFGFNKKVIVFLGKENGIPKILIPLMLLERTVFHFKLRFVEFIGQQWGASTFTILKVSDSPFDFDSFMHVLKQNISYDILYLRNISMSYNKQFAGTLIKNAGCPQIQIQNDNFEDFYTHLPKQLKQNIRTAYNRAKKKNEVLVEKIVNGTDICWEKVIEISRSKKNDGKYSLYDDALKSQFYMQLPNFYDTNFVLIYLDERVVAYRYNILYNGLKFCVDAAYDRKFPHYNLGALSVLNNIKDSFDLHLDTHSMGPGCYDYKLKFTSDINYLGYLVRCGNRYFSLLFNWIFIFYLRKFHKKQL